VGGSGAKVRRLLADPEVTVVAVEHRGRLDGLNAELVEAALAAHGRKLVVVDNGGTTSGARHGRGVHWFVCPPVRAPVGLELGVEGGRGRPA
jgi:hypothetical protein